MMLHPTRERLAVFEKGAHFAEVNGTLMFSFRIDPSSEIGPMSATEDHIAKHQSAYQAFIDEQAESLNPLAVGVNDIDTTPPINIPHEPQPYWNNAIERPKRGPGRPRKDEAAA
jgi:hypothetical protein